MSTVKRRSTNLIKYIDIGSEQYAHTWIQSGSLSCRLQTLESIASCTSVTLPTYLALRFAADREVPGAHLTYKSTNRTLLSFLPPEHRMFSKKSVVCVEDYLHGNSGCCARRWRWRLDDLPAGKKKARRPTYLLKRVSSVVTDLCQSSIWYMF